MRLSFGYWIVAVALTFAACGGGGYAGGGGGGGGRGGGSGQAGGTTGAAGTGGGGAAGTTGVAGTGGGGAAGTTGVAGTGGSGAAGTTGAAGAGVGGAAGTTSAAGTGGGGAAGTTSAAGTGGAAGGTAGGGGAGGAGGAAPAPCGNGVLNANEACDDGNLVPGDGCTRLCQREAGWDCPTPGSLCVPTPVCGNTRVDPNEECDDGNTAGGDGCAANCRAIEAGWHCRVPGTRCAPRCGDAMVVGTEQCDDGNDTPLDGCSSACLIESGAICGAVPGAACRVAVCGNGIVETGEACDAGADNGLYRGDGSGCSKTCTREPACRSGGGSTRACDIACGNGFVETGEACDDGNLRSGDGCSQTCVLEPGFSCTVAPREDTEACTTGQCLRQPITYRDFKSEKETGGHPDFFYMGAPVSPAVNISGVQGQPGPVEFNKRYCVPDAAGPAKRHDATARCWDMAQTYLDAAGKPAFNTTRTNGTLCDCQFIDWSSDTNGNHVPGISPSASPTTGLTYVDGAQGHPMYRGLAPIVKDAASFAQWFTDSSASIRSTGTIELAHVTGVTYRFASNPHVVYGGFFPVDPVINGFPIGGSMSGPGGATTVPVSGEPLLCNIWPYWYSSASFGNGAGCRGDQYLFPPSVAGAQYPSGMWVTNVQGWRHNFWSTTELRRHFVHTGAPFGIEFVGDDDLFIFINGVLVVDLGGTHQRLPGRIDVTSDVTAGGIASIVEGGAVDPATDSTLNCPSADPYTQLFANSTTNSDGNGHLNCTSANCDCRRRMLGLGLQMGRSYEIAIFHADRHPPHSNYQLTMRLPSAPRTTCQPVCGNGTVTIDEQCDAGTSNNDATYGGCTTACRLGPHCGDGVKNGPEDCDLGLTNGAAYGNRNGCSRACKYVRFCGDSVVDLADGEQCDFGSNNGASGTPCDSTCRLLTP